MSDERDWSEKLKDNEYLNMIGIKVRLVGVLVFCTGIAGTLTGLGIAILIPAGFTLAKIGAMVGLSGAGIMLCTLPFWIWCNPEKMG